MSFNKTAKCIKKLVRTTVLQKKLAKNEIRSRDSSSCFENNENGYALDKMSKAISQCFNHIRTGFEFVFNQITETFGLLNATFFAMVNNR